LRFYFSFAAIRFRFYLKAGGQLFLRHWQWFLVAGMLSPGLPIVQIFKLPAALFAAIASNASSLQEHLALLFIIQAVSIVWILPQLTLLRGGEFRSYTETLPLTKTVRTAVSASLLGVVDILAFIPAIAGFTEDHPPPDNAAPVFRILALLAVLTNLLLVQVGIVERLQMVTSAAIVAAVPLSAALMSPSRAGGWLLLFLAACIPSIALCIPDRVRVRLRAHSRVAARVRVLSGGHGTRWIPPTLRVQMKALGERPIMVGLTVLAAVGLAEGIDALISVFAYDARSVPVAIGGMAAIALMSSGLSRHLRNMHQPVEAFLSTLPLRHGFWPVRDVVLVALFSFPPVGLLLFSLARHGLASLSIVVALSASYAVLLAALRATLVMRGRFSVLSSVALAVLWASSAIAEVTR
jgi:hypothetical protein